MRRKDAEREQARELRRRGRSLREIARELDVSLSSASVWVRDIPRHPPAPTGEAETAASTTQEPAEPSRRCGRCRQVLPESAFSRHPRKGRQWWCKECFRQYFRKRGDLHKRQSAASRERRLAKAKAFVRQHLATHPCVECGESDPRVLEFDHVGPKSTEISVLTHNGAPISIIRKEIESCEVVCANCHRRRTGERAGWPRAQKRWWRAKRPARSYAAARNLAYAYSVLERSACIDCGFTDMCALEFDHISIKRGAVMTMAWHEVSLRTLEDEISRCENRCANCHRRRSIRNQQTRCRTLLSSESRRSLIA